MQPRLIKYENHLCFPFLETIHAHEGVCGPLPPENFQNSQSGQFFLSKSIIFFLIWIFPEKINFFLNYFCKPLRFAQNCKYFLTHLSKFLEGWPPFPIFLSMDLNALSWSCKANSNESRLTAKSTNETNPH